MTNPDFKLPDDLLVEILKKNQAEIRRKRTRLLALFISLVLYIGSGVLLIYVDWRILVAVFLMIYANNISVKVDNFKDTE